MNTSESKAGAGGRQTWTCRIGVEGSVSIPHGADGPMRKAVGDAFLAVTGVEAEHCFSGWGDKWDERELAVIENRAPRIAALSRDEAAPGDVQHCTCPSETRCSGTCPYYLRTHARTPATPGAGEAEGVCDRCGAPTDPDYGHVGDCRPAPAHAAGEDLVLVPREPTEAMLACGHKKIDWCRDSQNTNLNDHPSQTDHGGTNCKTDLRDAYTAMLAAAPRPAVDGPRYFTDLAGTIPAKPGDRVALVFYGLETMEQRDPHLRPTLAAPAASQPVLPPCGHDVSWAHDGCEECRDHDAAKVAPRTVYAAPAASQAGAVVLTAQERDAIVSALWVVNPDRHRDLRDRLAALATQPTARVEGGK